MSRVEQQLRDLLELAVGEPPRPVTVEAIRRRVVRRRAAAAATAAGAAALVATGAVLAVSLPGGVGGLGVNRPRGAVIRSCPSAFPGRERLAADRAGATSALVPGRPVRLTACRYGPAELGHHRALTGSGTVRGSELAFAVSSLNQLRAAGMQGRCRLAGSPLVLIFGYRSGPPLTVIAASACGPVTNGAKTVSAGAVGAWLLGNLTPPLARHPAGQSAAGEARLAGNGPGPARFGQPAPQVLAELNAILGPPMRPYQASGAGCGIDHEIDWPGLAAYFGRGTLVGYSYQGAYLQTTAGLKAGDSIRRARRLYGRALRLSFEQGGAWFARTPAGQLDGFTYGRSGNRTDIGPDSRVGTIEAGAVGCAALGP